jgi:hypothetical protein
VVGVELIVNETEEEGPYWQAAGAPTSKHLAYKVILLLRVCEVLILAPVPEEVVYHLKTPVVQLPDNVDEYPLHPLVVVAVAEEGEGVPAEAVTATLCEVLYWHPDGLAVLKHLA